MSDSGCVGHYFETVAAEYLAQQGWILHSRNVSCRYGELDLIGKLGPTWVFVEVKYRRSLAYGGPAAAVTAAKQHKLRQSAAWFLQQQRSTAPCRFDVIAISGDSPYQIDWLKSAF